MDRRCVPLRRCTESISIFYSISSLLISIDCVVPGITRFVRSLSFIRSHSCCSYFVQRRSIAVLFFRHYAVLFLCVLLTFQSSCLCCGRTADCLVLDLYCVGVHRLIRIRGVDPFVKVFGVHRGCEWGWLGSLNSVSDSLPSDFSLASSIWRRAVEHAVDLWGGAILSRVLRSAVRSIISVVLLRDLATTHLT